MNYKSFALIYFSFQEALNRALYQNNRLGYKKFSVKGKRILLPDSKVWVWVYYCGSTKDIPDPSNVNDRPLSCFLVDNGVMHDPHRYYWGSKMRYCDGMWD